MAGYAAAAEPTGDALGLLNANGSNVNAKPMAPTSAQLGDPLGSLRIDHQFDHQMGRALGPSRREGLDPKP